MRTVERRADVDGFTDRVEVGIRGFLSLPPLKRQTTWGCREAPGHLL